MDRVDLRNSLDPVKKSDFFDLFWYFFEQHENFIFRQQFISSEGLSEHTFMRFLMLAEKMKKKSENSDFFSASQTVMKPIPVQIWNSLHQYTAQEITARFDVQNTPKISKCAQI